MEYLQNVRLDAIVTNPLNTYDVDQVEDLEWSLRLFGLLTPLTVVDRGDGTYKLISGERRYIAMNKINEADGEKVFDEIPCYVKEDHLRLAGSKEPMDDSTVVEQLMIEISNIDTREISKTDLNEHRFQVISLLRRAIDNGIIPDGDLLKKIQNLLAISPRYSRMFLTIFERGTDDVKELVSEGELAIHEAANVSNMDADSQAEVVRKIVDEGEKPKDAIKSTKNAASGISDAEQMVIDSGNIEGDFGMGGGTEDDFSEFTSIIGNELKKTMDYAGSSDSKDSTESSPDTDSEAYEQQIKAATALIVNLRNKGDFSESEMALGEEMRSTLNYMDAILL